MKKWLIFVLGAYMVVCMMAVMEAEAEEITSFRCGSYLIVPGDNALQIRARCGDPAGHKKGIKGAVISTTLDGEGSDEEWVYNMGPTDFVYTLRFSAGQLHAISREGRGF